MQGVALVAGVQVVVLRGVGLDEDQDKEVPVLLVEDHPPDFGLLMQCRWRSCSMSDGVVAGEEVALDVGMEGVVPGRGCWISAASSAG